VTLPKKVVQGAALELNNLVEIVFGDRKLMAPLRRTGRRAVMQSVRRLPLRHIAQINPTLATRNRFRRRPLQRKMASNRVGPGLVRLSAKS
jgi:hypothetical protein